MSTPIGSRDEPATVAVADIAIGEALFASAVATVALTGQIASGRLAMADAETLLDGAMLVLERHRGSGSRNEPAIDHALQRLRALLHNLLSQAAPATARAPKSNGRRPAA